MKPNRLNSWRLQALLAGALLALPVTAPGLEPDKSLFQFNCQNWTRQNGLPADKINSICQTRDGYVWLGTQNGLARFDGNEFKVFKVSLAQAQGQNVRNLCPAKKGGLWFVIEDGGFGAFDGQTFSAIPDDRWNRSGNNATTILETQDGAVWTGDVYGLGCWNGGKPGASFFAETNGNVRAFCEGRNGKVWVATVDRGVACWTDGRPVQIPDEFLKQHNMSALVEDADGRIWVGTDSGLRCYDAQGRRQAVPVLDNPVQALLLDSHGILWVGTTGSGLARLEGGEFTYLRKADGLSSDSVTSLCEDAEGSLWVGTQEGLSQLTDLRFPIYSKTEGLADGSSHTVTASAKGGVWITTTAGFSYFDGKSARNYTNLDVITNGYIKLGFEARNGNFYFVDANKNIRMLAGEVFTTICQSSVWPSALAEDSGSVLVGLGPALNRVNQGKIQPYEYHDPAPDYYWINNLCVSRDGSIWVASNNGIYRLQDGHVTHISAVDGLSSDRIQWLCEDMDGAIWAGLNTGLARIKDGRIKNIREEDGLTDDRICAMVPDDERFFWLCTGRGILRVARQSLNDFADGKMPRIQCESFEGQESVKSNARTDQEYSGCKSLDGSIWFPNPLGVVKIEPAHFFVNRVAPQVWIQQIKVNGVTLANRRVPALRAGNGNLEFRFAVLSYVAVKKARVRYQLAGFDPTWIEAGDRLVASYNNLHAGRYSFHVQACNADGAWNTVGDGFSVEFPPLFYQTVWFDVLCGFVGLLGVFGAYRWKVYHLELQQQKLRVQNDLLEAKVGKRTGQLAQANAALREEIAGREKLHHQLLEASRQAGKAEVAIEVLHNVGNVLNSVNISASIIAATVRNSASSRLTKVSELWRDPHSRVAGLLAQDEKARHLPPYLETLATELNGEKTGLLQEIMSLTSNIDHIKEIVAMQQANARLAGVSEILPAVALVEDAIRMNHVALERHQIALVRRFEEVPPMLVDRHKVLQILVNLLKNAKLACVESGRADKEIKAWIKPVPRDRIQIGITDNGVGIDPANLTRIFAHGFTTRCNGHGFGLHSGALAARDLGGSLTVHSDGPGQGASFILELPVQNEAAATPAREFAKLRGEEVSTARPAASS